MNGGEEVLNADPDRRDGLDGRAKDGEDRGMAQGKVSTLPGGEERELGLSEGDEVSDMVKEGGEEMGFIRDSSD